MKSPYKQLIKQLTKQGNDTVRRAFDISLKDCDSWEEYIDIKIKAFINMGIAPMTRDIIEGELNYEINKLAYNKAKINKYIRNEKGKETQRKAIKNWESNPKNYYSGQIMEGRALKIQNKKRSRKI